MKKLLITFFVFSFLFSKGQNIPPPPSPPRLVNDFAHALTPDQVQSLEAKLVAYDDSTSIQIAVVTVPTTGDYAIEDYALKILRDWKVGNKKTNNGLVILASIQDHKVFIATGYGMEGSIPDITAKEIIDNEILPSFKQGNFYRGFDLATDAIIKAAAGEYKAPEGYGSRVRGKPGGGLIGLGIIVFIVLILISRGGRGGGGMFRGSGMLPFLLGTMIGSGGRGGGWSGGGEGGGGFGGFGGGSGGGGGAGGSW
ncbi:MAG TPA: TPM domain-containing protein [Puia sp.]|nr:TPM domain-containing protein [Puia sp.]